MAKNTSLTDLSPNKIKANPENPRLIFRQNELEELKTSIEEVGIQVPLTVYKEKSHYIILDGERRWRCAKELGLPTVPVIVQPKPSPLENLLMMFNIHKVRVDWDLLPTAQKLGEVRDLLVESGEDEPDVKRLAAITGMSKSLIRNCLELLDLPVKYQRILLDEAEKPANEQRITPDLFIEIRKSQRVVRKHAPEVFKDVTERQYLDTMYKKYKQGVVKNIVQFRDVSKIARAERAGMSKKKVLPILKQLVTDQSYTITEAFEDSVKGSYEQRDLESRALALIDRLQAFRLKTQIAKGTRDVLIRLRDRITKLLG